MAFDATPAPPTAWTTASQLTPDQRARYGSYIEAKDEVRAGCEANREARERTEAALRATGGNELAAMGLLLGGSV